MSEITKEKVTQFLNLTSKEDLAKLLEVKYSTLTYYLYILEDEQKYELFKIPKRNGGQREIIAPQNSLKFCQKNLAKILLEIYPPKSIVHGYCKERGIISNAEQHKRKKIIVNIDLENFFPTIHFGRVRGLFKADPFNFEDTIATTLAQITTYNGYLPQGAPTSPIISNFICRRLDNGLLSLCKKNRLTITRYADDITISTNILPLPYQIGKIQNNNIFLGQDLVNIIEDNDFKINYSKVRYARGNNRQVVTGLITNEFVNIPRNYIRKVRAMLHAWEKFGARLAAEEHYKKYDCTNPKLENSEYAFERKLAGMIGYIGMVKGKGNPIYLKLFSRIKRLSPNVPLTAFIEGNVDVGKPLVFGEGKTDWKHLKTALKALQSKGNYTELVPEFREVKDTEEMSDSVLLQNCETLAREGSQSNKIICIFDADNPQIIKKVTENSRAYKSWGNNVYSFVLPKPDHRDFEQVCIEHYYLDNDLKTVDENGRRLYLSDEFDKRSGRHINEELTSSKPNLFKRDYPAIVDSDVWDLNSNNVAMSKSEFAENIYSKKEGYSSFSFDAFTKIFDVISKIIIENY